MKNATCTSILILLTLLASACAAQTPAPTPAPADAQVQAIQEATFEPITFASAKRVVQVFPTPGQSDNLSAAWVYGWDGLIMMEDTFYFDDAGSLHWTSTLPEALDYACTWDLKSDPACRMVTSAPEKAGGPYTLLAEAGAGDLYAGVIDGRKFTLLGGIDPGSPTLIQAELPEGTKALNLRYFPAIKTAALHLRLNDPVKDVLLVVGDAAGAPYLIDFCRPFNASTDPAKTLNDLMCMLSRDGKYQLGRGDVPEIIETAGGSRVGLLTPEILTGYPDMNSMLAWPDGKSVGYINQKIGADGKIFAIDILKFDPENKELAASIPLGLGSDELNQLHTDYAISPDESLLAISSLSNVIYLVDLRTGGILKTLEFNSPATRLAFSPDGRFLAAGFYNRQIVVFGSAVK